MNRLPLIAIVSIPMFAFSPLGQDTAAKHGGAAQDSLPTAEEQMKALNGKLDLTAEQQIKIKPILQELHAATQSIMEDQTLSRDERLVRVRPHRRLADRKIREFLSAEQKKKLDQFELGPHQELHGTLSGTPKPPVQ
jgi:hypothetical protein